MQNANISCSTLPFAMNFAQIPSQTDVLDSVAATYTTTYNTDCGPNNSPDDAPGISNDDN